jgi:hypothetical protein
MFEDLLKEHVDHMEQPKLLKGFIHNKAVANDEVMHPLPLEGTTKEDIMQMVEATAIVYKVMEEQDKMDSFLPKELAILKDEMCLSMNLLCSYAAPREYQNMI